MTIRYEMPGHWIRYDPMAIIQEMMGAKAAILALTQMPKGKVYGFLSN